MMNRRKFLAISAALVVPHGAQAAKWQGRAFGADVSITIRAPREVADAALQAARFVIAQVERLFSLYDQNSALAQLNRNRTLSPPDPRFLALMQAADVAHDLTDGRFDPTVQPVWTALANGTTVRPDLVGWNRVQFDATQIALGSDQALTFNGIAQGFATDLVTEALARFGLTDVLVNIGEHRGVGGPWKLGISDPALGNLGNQTLTTGAVATSSPAALLLGREAHILMPGLQAQWSTVSVTARTATLADALSTGLCLAARDVIDRVVLHEDVDAVRLVDFAGDLITVS